MNNLEIVISMIASGQTKAVYHIDNYDGKKSIPMHELIEAVYGTKVVPFGEVTPLQKPLDYLGIGVSVDSEYIVFEVMITRVDLAVYVIE